MDKQLRYRYSYIHRGAKLWLTSPPTLATVEAFLFSNDLDADIDAAEVLKLLDTHGTFVAVVERSEDTIKAGTDIVEINEVYV